MSGTGPVAYRYATPSVLVGDVLSFATSGGVTEAGAALHPYFFTGFLAEPGPAAQALLATAAIARAQYYVAAGTSRVGQGVRYGTIDPVVTSNTDRLRFESFSSCCGVHARLDLPVPSVTTARCCVAVTAALLDERPTGLHLLLEVAARAAAVCTVPELPASVAALSGEGTSKLAEAARRLSRLAI